MTQSDLETVKRNFKWVADQLDFLVPPPSAHVVILMGSPSDEEHCKKIAQHATALGLKARLRVTSAHKAPQETLRILAELEGSGDKVKYNRILGFFFSQYDFLMLNYQFDLAVVYSTRFDFVTGSFRILTFVFQ